MNQPTEEVKDIVKKLGRPKGSKNKPKTIVNATEQHAEHNPANIS